MLNTLNENYFLKSLYLSNSEVMLSKHSVSRLWIPPVPTVWVLNGRQHHVQIIYNFALIYQLTYCLSRCLSVCSPCLPSLWRGGEPSSDLSGPRRPRRWWSSPLSWSGPSAPSYPSLPPSTPQQSGCPRRGGLALAEYGVLRLRLGRVNVKR